MASRAWKSWIACKRYASTSASERHKFQNTLCLPSINFPTRVDGSNDRKTWSQVTDQLFEWQSAQTSRPLFILHDGPPYANGPLHAGHMLNKILKDIVLRVQIASGSRVHYIPGWDTHGLPIELKALKSNRKITDPKEIRAAARKEAEASIELQKQGFLEMGILADWNTVYKTFTWDYEKRQLEVFRNMVQRKFITHGQRPTYYSPSSKTALAESELEYRAIESVSMYVSTPLTHVPEHLDQNTRSLLLQSHLVIWTTTPWTLPSNLAIAVSPEITYIIVKSSRKGIHYVVADALVKQLESVLDESLIPLASVPGLSLDSSRYRALFGTCERAVFTASYVTDSAGTGLVHAAPAHGMEDYAAYRERYPNDLISCAVDGNGKFVGDVLEDDFNVNIAEQLRGMFVLSTEATDTIEKSLNERGLLLGTHTLVHQYPCDWRTKKPVIQRATSQWFASVDAVKDDATRLLDDVSFVPPSGHRHLEKLVQGRSQWCISRQRAWGVPIPAIYVSGDEEKTWSPILTPESISHIIAVLDKHGGSDYWWEGSVEEFMEPKTLKDVQARNLKITKGLDTLDVWFDSGTSWTMLPDRANVVLEGSDQYRGWFQSSLLTKVSAKNELPFRNVITHGFVVDDKNEKMSKSKGNVSTMASINATNGKPHSMDVYRLWAASVDYTSDVVFSPQFISQISGVYNKLRNVMRFLLAFAGEVTAEAEAKQLSVLDKYILHELSQTKSEMLAAYKAFAFQDAMKALTKFMNTELSSVYFVAVKDCLYAEAVHNPARLAVVHTLQMISRTLTSLMAPIVPHLAAEAHELQSELPFASVAWTDEYWDFHAEHELIQDVLRVGSVVSKLLEDARKSKYIGKSLEAAVLLRHSTASRLQSVDKRLLSNIFAVSGVEFIQDTPHNLQFEKDGVYLTKASGHKCPRCWMHTSTSADTLCARCETVVG